MYHNNPDKILLKKLLQGETVACHHAGNLLAEALNLKVINVEQQTILLHFSVGATFTQAHGMLQGGILTAMMDFGAAFLGVLQVAEQQSIVTTHLSTQFFRPAAQGEYFVSAKLDKAGAKMIFVSAQLYQQPEKPIAAATFSMAVV